MYLEITPIEDQMFLWSANKLFWAINRAPFADTQILTGCCSGLKYCIEKCASKLFLDSFFESEGSNEHRNCQNNLKLTKSEKAPMHRKRVSNRLAGAFLDPTPLTYRNHSELEFINNFWKNRINFVSQYANIVEISCIYKNSSLKSVTDAN